MRLLLPLHCHPGRDPLAWDTAAGLGPGATVVVDVDSDTSDNGPGDGSPGDNGPGGGSPGDNGPGDGSPGDNGPGGGSPGDDGSPGPRPGAGYAWAMARLAAAGVPVLGRVDLGHAARPLAAVLADVRRWIAYPAGGVFLDRAPADARDAGLVALAVRVARRAGLSDVVLNPGVPAEDVYRELGVELCCFEGHWTEYTRWNGAGARPGDGHLVYGVPPDQTAAAWRLLAAYGAGFGLVTDREAAAPYAGLPAWCSPGEGPGPGTGWWAATGRQAATDPPPVRDPW